MTPRTALLSLALAPSVVLAQQAAPEPPPPADEIRRVLDYQENGKERGPALIDLVPCLKVDNTKGSPTINTCVEPVSGPVKKGTTVFAWSMWFCPRDGKYDDVMLQFLHEGVVRNTIDLTIAGLARVRSWRGTAMTKPGQWEIKVLRGGRELGSTTVQVEP